MVTQTACVGDPQSSSNGRHAPWRLCGRVGGGGTVKCDLTDMVRCRAVQGPEVDEKLSEVWKASCLVGFW